MADHRLRLMLLKEYFLQNTDETHTVTTPELLSYLADNEIDVDRRTVYSDIALLKSTGMDIQKRRTRTHDYYLASRSFSLPELKLLVDAVQSCRFLTGEHSTALIEKLERLASRYQAAQLSRQVYVQNRLKSGNALVYRNVDSIHTAIQSCMQIRFQYCQYGMDKRLHPRRDGMFYEISPYLLTWAEDNYYLIGNHPMHEGLAHYRVDKMQNVAVTNAARVPLSPLFDPAEYAKSMFSMYAGQREWVEMEFNSDLIGVVMDRFGTDVPIHATDAAHFSVRALVSVSPSFFGWLLQFGEQARILAPADAKERMGALLTSAAQNYPAENPENS